MKEKPTICDGAGIGDNPIVSPRAAAFFDKVLELAIADGIDADDERATKAHLDKSKREWGNVRNRAAKFWPHFNEAGYLTPSADAPLHAIELSGKVLTGKDESLLIESERVGNKLAIAYIYKKATARLSECVDVRELKENRANTSRRCSTNGKKGAAAARAQRRKDPVREKIVEEAKRKIRERDDNHLDISNNAIFSNVAKRHLDTNGLPIMKAAAIKKALQRRRKETRGRYNRSREQ